ncbi:MAG: vault protein inter-alpha-trypsin subunit, partial [Acidobacteria bacterium]|nr:vault protein inter-alpha-trypsin subunit [Acidobacteriota bacterium]
PGDSFNVLFFSGGNWVLSPSSLPATEANKTRAMQEIEGQSGGGGTELLPALRQAFGLPRSRPDVARTIVLATDGFVNVEREAFTLVRDRLGDANLFAFGIGSSVNRHLIEGLARTGEGLPFVVLGPGEAPRAASRFLEYIESPLLTRVEVRTPGFQAYDLEPGRLPDLFAERPLVLAGKYRGEAAGEIVVTGFTGEGRFERRIAVNRGRVVPGGEALRYLWARERLSVLSDLAGTEIAGIAGTEAAVTGAEAERKQAIVKLGLEYGLLTEFTSFVAVDQVVRRTDGRVTTVKQPLPLPQGVTELAVGGTVGGVSRKMLAAAEALASPSPVLADGRPTQVPGSGRGQEQQAPPAPRVELVENRATGRALGAAAVKEAVRRALSAAGCAPTASPLRVRIAFGARGEVTSVQRVGQGASQALADCLRRALRSIAMPGTTGGWVVVEVEWR